MLLSDYAVYVIFSPMNMPLRKERGIGLIPGPTIVVNYFKVELAGRFKAHSGRRSLRERMLRFRRQPDPLLFFSPLVESIETRCFYLLVHRPRLGGLHLQ